ncbi:hypothetical protein ACLB2K_075936 [Fragaria x ananassa]
MEALIASYGEPSSDSDTESPAPPPEKKTSQESAQVLPPPPLSLLDSPNSLGFLDYSASQASRVRNFPHVEGNYALHVYIPVYIPAAPRKEMALFMRRLSSVVSGLHAVDVDVPLEIDSLVAMLKQKLQTQRRYWIDFSKWEVFVNDDHTRTFVSVEVITAGLAEITKQIQAVNEVYKLHNLPEFYKDPRPHISVAWALGDTSSVALPFSNLKKVVEDERRKSTVAGSLQKSIFTSRFSGIECKIGNKTHKICKFSDE